MRLFSHEVAFNGYGELSPEQHLTTPTPSCLLSLYRLAPRLDRKQQSWRITKPKETIRSFKGNLVRLRPCSAKAVLQDATRHRSSLLPSTTPRFQAPSPIRRPTTPIPLAVPGRHLRPPRWTRGLAHRDRVADLLT
ncbi:hypothetical protein CSOJ01_01472 [Colletotrichum sojae]|uniref:Uncharacterized protein n=1 Tax=Colletotrichum sojae TaxID=2175907 RepID=A0A8H6JTG6_9PEZI|nr:hypothetical protein CSOJ01_01472 [Colletotrichum sojae]